MESNFIACPHHFSRAYGVAIEWFTNISDHSTRLDDDFEIELVWVLVINCSVIDCAVLLVVWVECLRESEHIGAALDFHNLN